ncbi:hypothetical protein V5799_032684 [Amblyomma americanum]|uniref:Uncharacterized protein n=1 Tax=Amblyomma americanum TaxID=6943 RepID=A0AAQ4DQG3_AMBAM
MPYIRFGYPDCLSFLVSLADTVDMQRTGDDVLISTKLYESVRHVQTLVQAQDAREPAGRPSASQLPEAVLENILKLVGEDDVHERVLRDAYCRCFGLSLDIEQYDFAPLEDCLARVRLAANNATGLPQAIVAVLAEYPECIYMSLFTEAYARERGRTPTSRSTQLVRRWSRLFYVQKLDSSGDFIPHPGIYSAAVLLPPEFLPVLSSVHVTDSPTVLTMALLTPESESSLFLLRVTIDHFYGSVAFGPPFDVEPGLYCAELCSKTWLRAHVVAVTDHVMQVELADVGGRRSVAAHRLRILAPRFTDLLALCTVATLTLPPGTRACCDTVGERPLEMTQGFQLAYALTGFAFGSRTIKDSC